ncbi:MAG: bifunctional adenosylcobinamide kinase/adenosylcobinamide-phosphate guanylyltransferase [Deltaproteobacteria bacterium]|nr:bifunctional adenosylcobinamide kinase/adenosylcobinamide-phosphate guanylyltransferase [Deltaproteobacteria bacterium]
MGDIVLYLGGAKSGKTRAALAAAEAFGPPRYYLATAEALDSEMALRIRAHQAERGPDWRTAEEPLDPAGAVSSLPPEGPVLLDCLTLWLSNLMGRREDLSAADWIIEVDKLIGAARGRKGPTIIVSNEVGGGLVPMEPLSRLFRDLSGLAHQRIASVAKEAYLVVAGLPMRLK